MKRNTHIYKLVSNQIQELLQNLRRNIVVVYNPYTSKRISRAWWMTNWLRRQPCLHTALFCVFNHVRTTTVSTRENPASTFVCSWRIIFFIFVSPSGLSHVGKKSRQWKQRTSEHRSSIKEKTMATTQQQHIWKASNRKSCRSGSRTSQTFAGKRNGMEWKIQRLDRWDWSTARHALISVFKVLHRFKWLVKH